MNNAVLRPAEFLAQLGFRLLQALLLRCRQVAAGAVDVEVQHRHRRLIGRALAALAAICRALERAGEPLRAAAPDPPPPAIHPAPPPPPTCPPSAFPPATSP